jgi:hypothetical protein
MLGHFLCLEKFKGYSKLFINDRTFSSSKGRPITRTPTGRPAEPIAFCFKADVIGSLKELS